MASRCCGNRLSLPNQYDTKTPRASVLSAAAKKPRFASVYQGRSLPAGSFVPGGLASRIKLHSVRLEMPLEKFLKFQEKNFGKFLRSFPTADFAFRTPAKSKKT